VTASAEVNVASRMERRRSIETDASGVYGPPRGGAAATAVVDRATDRATERSPQRESRSTHDDLTSKLNDLYSMVEDLRRRGDAPAVHDMPEPLFRLFADLIDADVSEELARELIRRIQSEAPGEELSDPTLAKARIARMIEQEIRTTGPIRVEPGKRRVIALVGPTGVGKTTTIAKLAANYRLREKRRVGLITVDTYRIAAVEQMRTYADIMDLPMEVVSTPREMRAAVERLADLDVVFMDTAGRSPKDELKIQELKSMLAEADADEVHLVLSSVASAKSLMRTADQFAAVGTTALALTKLDEASGLGNLLPLLRGCRLPLSYLTDGQNVPDDIQVAQSRRLARVVLGMETGD
jgi:flagellar biosynthesis protein FlhF